MGWVGQPARPLSYTELLSNYVNDYNVTACRATIDNLALLFTNLTNFTSAKYLSLQGLLGNIQNQKSGLDNLTILLRNNYLLKKRQLSYLKSLGAPN